MKTFYTMSSAAKYFNCSPRQLQRYVSNMPAFKVAKIKASHSLYFFGPVEMLILGDEIARLRAAGQRHRRRNEL